MSARSVLRIVLVLTLPTALASGVALAAPAVAADAGWLRVRTPAHLVDGGVDLRVRARCAEGLTAFELGATVRQGATTATLTLVERDVVPCDGRPHTRVLRLVPADAAFSVGRARVDAHLGTFSEEAGEAFVNRSSRIRIAPERTCPS